MSTFRLIYSVKGVISDRFDEKYNKSKPNCYEVHTTVFVKSEVDAQALILNWNRCAPNHTYAIVGFYSIREDEVKRVGNMTWFNDNGVYRSFIDKEVSVA